MTQEVQPLVWQKRTNLEEHQQFFSKINEIIANLAPTVNEAEAAIAQATQAIASANAAIETANAASANADAASQQAQTAANTVAGYDTRLTAMENADTQNVKLDTNQVIRGNKTFTKTLFTQRNFNFDATAGNQWGGEIQMNSESTKVGAIENFISGGNLDLQLFSQNPISNKYGSMGIHLSRDGKTNYCFGFNPTANAPSNAFTTKGYVESTDGVTNNLVHRTTNEIISGTKDFTSSIKLTNSSWRFDCVFPDLDNANPSAVTGYIRIGAGSGSTYEIGRIQYAIRDNGNRYFALYLVDKTGGYHSKVLFEIDNDGNTVV